MYKVKKLQGYIIQHGGYSQYFIITSDGVSPLNCESLCCPICNLYNTHQLCFNLKKVTFVVIRGGGWGIG